MSDTQVDLTPCYRADCPTCHGWVAVSVADVNRPESMTRALVDRRKWLRDGYLISTVTVQSIRDGQKPGHTDDCPLKPKRKTIGGKP